MIKNPRTRRAIAVIMMVLGAILMFLAPEVWQGALLLALGVAHWSCLASRWSTRLNKTT